MTAMADDWDDDTTLGTARDWLRARVEEGAYCPCCTQFAKVYKRKITSPMARGLIKQHRLVGRDYAHSAELVKSETHEFSQLSWWGLVEELAERRGDGGKAGWWRITELGNLFVRNLAQLPKYARVYDGRRLNLVIGERVSIQGALGTKFDYSDLMRGE
jgi:hypothetical protein